MTSTGISRTCDADPARRTMPLRVRVHGAAGIRCVPLSDELKEQLYSYVAAACRQ